MRRNSTIILTAIFLVVAVTSLSAQHNSKGKEFWVTFMSCGGNALNGSTDMRLYLACDRPTSATITYMLDGHTEDIAMPTANKAVEINVTDVFGGDVELDNVDSSSNGISGKSFRITANDEITVYGVSVRVFSGDAFLGLPDDALTGRYIVLAYPNGYDGFAPEDYDMPSEFAIVATEDGTTVRITPPGNTNINGHPDKIFTIGLNRGEVFFGQAQLHVKQDVSGTEIVANKPVAVFGGNRRTSIPTEVGNFRDFLVEQMPPLEAWGKEAIVTPHYPITPASPYPAVFKVLAAFDGTNWTIDGTPQPPLQRGKSVEDTLDRPMHIVADQPILVAQYEHSVGQTDSNQNFELGDPFMMLIPPPEQYDTAYAFQSITHEEFPVHYINVVIPSNDTAGLRLDQPFVASFQPVPGTRYSYAQIEVKAGAHFIRADSGFGLYAYGYGPANSYGYPGGMLFRTLVTDFQPPELEQSDNCARLDGVFTDSHITDTGIDSCYATSETSNVTMTIAAFKRHADTVHYSATLIDPYQDGLVGIKAIDSVGRSRTQITPIPGFTLRAVGMNANTPLHLDTLVAFNGSNICTTIRIENYGRYPHTIDSIQLTPNFGQNVVVTTPMPITIAPGGAQDIQLCTKGWIGPAVVNVALSIAGDCQQREVADVPIVSAIDTTAPSIAVQSVPCSDAVMIDFTDLPSRPSGIRLVSFDTLINCSAAITPDSSQFPVNRLQMFLHRIDVRQEMIYQVTIHDAAGNTIMRIDTIGGFTVAVLNRQEQPVSLRLGNAWTSDTLAYSTTRCDSVEVVNYGTRWLHLASVRLRGNESYSIPPSQLPLALAPGEHKRLAVCIAAGPFNEEGDTLEMTDECGNLEQVALKTPVTMLYGVGSDNCHAQLSIEGGFAKRTFLTFPVPNPAHTSEVEMEIGLVQSESVHLELVSQRGESFDVLRGTELPAGISKVQVDVSKLASGMYLCRLRTASGDVELQKLVVTR